MTSRRAVDGSVAQESLALVGVSRSGRGFGNSALRDLRAAGCRVRPVHPGAGEVQGLRGRRFSGK
jgi:hypothetical protein